MGYTRKRGPKFQFHPLQVQTVVPNFEAPLQNNVDSIVTDRQTDGPKGSRQTDRYT